MSTGNWSSPGITLRSLGLMDLSGLLLVLSCLKGSAERRAGVPLTHQQHTNLHTYDPRTRQV